MPPELFRKQYRIQSARAIWHNYNGGAYFITICTHGKKHYFGEIVGGEMHLSEIGRYADEQFRNVQSHYPYAQIPVWVVMPNHVHAIVIIDGEDHLSGSQCRDVARNVSTTAPIDSCENEYMAQKSPKHGSLAVVIRGIKSAISRFANGNAIPFAWQTRFHDHIVRDHHEMNLIADYIEYNVACWEADTLYA